MSDPAEYGPGTPGRPVIGDLIDVDQGPPRRKVSDLSREDREALAEFVERVRAALQALGKAGNQAERATLAADGVNLAGGLSIAQTIESLEDGSMIAAPTKLVGASKAIDRESLLFVLEGLRQAVADQFGRDRKVVFTRFVGPDF